MLERPNFLALPYRTSKPRTSGVTHVLDGGMTICDLAVFLDHCGDYVDVVKIGWGLGYIDPHLKDRAAVCRDAGVNLCLGGTLLEIAVSQGQVSELVKWAHRVGVRAVEVSNGLTAMTRGHKTSLVRELAEEFVVLAETGAKDDRAPVDPHQWVDEMEADLDAGASRVIAEGRESGTVGLYRSDGTPRTDLADEICSRIPAERVIFEAPTKSQQSWFVNRFGPNVGLGNVRPTDVLALETLRLGLRADTARTAPVLQASP